MSNFINPEKNNNSIEIIIDYQLDNYEQETNKDFLNNYGKKYIIDKHGIELLEYNNTLYSNKNNCDNTLYSNKNNCDNTLYSNIFISNYKKNKTKNYILNYFTNIMIKFYHIMKNININIILNYFRKLYNTYI